MCILNYVFLFSGCCISGDKDIVLLRVVQNVVKTNFQEVFKLKEKEGEGHETNILNVLKLFCMIDRFYCSELI